MRIASLCIASLLLAVPLSLAEPNYCTVTVLVTQPGAPEVEGSAIACASWWVSFQFYRVPGSPTFGFNVTAANGSCECLWPSGAPEGSCTNDGALWVEVNDEFHVRAWLEPGAGSVEGDVYVN